MQRKLIVRSIVALFVVTLMAATVHAQPTDPIPVQCGSTATGIVIEHGEGNMAQVYLIELSPGDTLTASASVRGDFPELRLNIGVFSPTEQNLNGFADWHIGEYYEHPTKMIEVGPLRENGVYEVIVLAGDTGAYTLEVGCTLADGTVIEPGSVAPIEALEAVSFSGFGFAGLKPVDFNDLPVIPVSFGQLYTDSLTSTGNEPSLYSYEAQANTSVKLSITRVSGDLSIGVAIVSVEDNSLIFMAGMPFADSISSQVTFPTNGVYIIGVFRLDVPPNKAGTSGTFEFLLR